MTTRAPDDGAGTRAVGEHRPLALTLAADGSDQRAEQTTPNSSRTNNRQ
jgi:hypothetical protein